MTPKSQPELIDRIDPEMAHPPTLPATVPAADHVVSLFERLAKDPSVDVEKLERLIKMQERILAFNEKRDFEIALSQMQGELPTIDENGRAVMPDGSVRYAYAKQEDIVEAVRPILQKYGFSIRFRHKHLENGSILVIGILSKGGHSEEDEFPCPPDKSGNKNDIQAIASTRTYGERYTTRSLLNIVSRDPRDPAADRDGHRPGGNGQAQNGSPAPAGFDDWFTDLTATADNGTKALMKTFSESKVEYRNHLVKTNLQGWTRLKERATKVQA